MDPRTFMSVADRYKSSTVEAEVRTSIGRSYYALFKTLSEWLTSIPKFVPDDGEAHRAVPYYFDRCTDREGQLLAGALHDLRGHRTNADYRMNPALVPRDSEFVYAKALQNLERFDRISTRIYGLILAVPSYTKKR
jgi:hypothetical protein